MEQATRRVLDIEARQLQPGDQVLNIDTGQWTYTILEVRRATAAEARVWAADGMRPGSIIGQVQWFDGGIGPERFWSPRLPLRVVRPDPA